MAHPIFSTDLILEKIFSFADLSTAKEMKLVSSSFSKNFKGCQGNIYLKLKDTDEVDSEAENEWILEWAMKPKNAWTLKRLKTPIHEAMRSCVIQSFLKLHGHKTTHLQLFRKEIEMAPDFRPVLCAPEAALIANALSKWCHNLKHLSILDNLEDGSNFREMHDLEFAESKLKTLEIIGSKYCGVSIVKDQPQLGFKVILNSPKLKELKISYEVNGLLFYNLNRGDSFRSNLQVVQLTTHYWISFRKLGCLTQENFPRLRKLSLNGRFGRSSIDFKMQIPLPLNPIHSGIKEICFTSDQQFEIYAACILTLFPKVESLKIGYQWPWYKGKWQPALKRRFPFPFVKKLSVGWDSMMKASRDISWPGPPPNYRREFQPPNLPSLLKMMPNVEKLEVVGVENFQELAEAIEGAENLKELELTIGENCNVNDLAIFPDHLTLTIH